MNTAGQALPGFAALGWLVLVLALIPLVLWLVKRSGYGQARGLPAHTRVVSSTALSATQRVVTLEVGEGAQRQWLVVGVTPQNLSLLHSAPAPQAGQLSAPQDGNP